MQPAPDFENQPASLIVSSHVQCIMLYKKTAVRRLYSAYISRIFSVCKHMERDKRAKFVELANNRVNRAIKDLRLISNLANRSSYEYSEDDARKITRALQRELDVLKARFEGVGRGGENEFQL